MAIWLYGHILTIWPLSHMAIWYWMWPIWVSTETAIKMQHSDEGIKVIGPSCKKLEQKWSDGQFSFVFFGNSFVFTKIGGHTTKMVRMSPTFFWWLLGYIHSPEQLSSILDETRWNPEQAREGLLIPGISLGKSA